MAAKALPCPTLLRQLLRYEPETGKLFYRTARDWMFNDGPKLSAVKRCSRWNKNHAGKQAFNTEHPVGYLVGAVFQIKIYAHRVAWAVHYGRWPDGEVDHNNRCKTDNRLCNLSDVTRTGNSRNKSLTRRNSSGHNGIDWRPDTQKWRAHIGVDCKFLSLGSFDTLQGALAARKAAEIKHGFSESHGKP